MRGVGGLVLLLSALVTVQCLTVGKLERQEKAYEHGLGNEHEHRSTDHLALEPERPQEGAASSSGSSDAATPKTDAAQKDTPKAEPADASPPTAVEAAPPASMPEPSSGSEVTRAVAPDVQHATMNQATEATDQEQTKSSKKAWDSFPRVVTAPAPAQQHDTQHQQHPGPAQVAGVVWMGPFLSRSGFAEEARSFAELLADDLPHLTAKHFGDESHLDVLSELAPAQQKTISQLLFPPPALKSARASPAVTVCHSVPSLWFGGSPSYYTDAQCPEPGGKGIFVGRAMFETDSLPDGWAAQINRMDEIWVPSHWNKETFQDAGVTVPIHVVPEAVDTEHRFNPELVSKQSSFPLPKPPAFNTRDELDIQLLQVETGNLVKTSTAHVSISSLPQPGSKESDGRLKHDSAVDEKAEAQTKSDPPLSLEDQVKAKHDSEVASVGRNLVSQKTSVAAQSTEPATASSTPSLAENAHTEILSAQVPDHITTVAAQPVQMFGSSPSGKPKITGLSQHHTGEHFKFLSVFKWHKRKGVDVLLKAYCNEFTSDDNVALYIKTNVYVGSPHEELKSILRELSRSLDVTLDQLPRIKIIDEWVPETRLAALYHAADAFVLPSRGEGWGLPMAEAMAMGLPTIATDWSGTTEFLDKDVGLPVKYTLRKLSREDMDDMYSGAQLEGHKYAEPDEDNLRQRMRWVVDNQAEAAALGAKARARMRENFSPEKVRQIIIDRLAEIAPSVVIASRSNLV